MTGVKANGQLSMIVQSRADYPPLEPDWNLPNGDIVSMNVDQSYRYSCSSTGLSEHEYLYTVNLPSADISSGI